MWSNQMKKICASLLTINNFKYMLLTVGTPNIVTKKKPNKQTTTTTKSQCSRHTYNWVFMYVWQFVHNAKPDFHSTRLCEKAQFWNIWKVFQGQIFYSNLWWCTTTCPCECKRSIFIFLDWFKTFAVWFNSHPKKSKASKYCINWKS